MLCENARIAPKSLRALLADSSDYVGRFLWGAKAGFALTDLSNQTKLGGRLGELAGSSVLLAIHDQLTSALAIIELDGVVRRLIICPPDLATEYLPALISKAQVDATISDYDLECSGTITIPLDAGAASHIKVGDNVEHHHATEWVLLTSGTTGAPKMLVHTLASLTAPIKKGQHQESDVVWGTFYDIRRYGGLQIFLRALLGHRSLVLSSADESSTDHLLRLRGHSATHLTGTPSHWRRVLMNSEARAIAPRYIRLSGETADQGILNMLRAFYPSANISHAFASTEAGVGFEVNDGREGFPATVLGVHDNIEIKVVERSLRIRSLRTAARYIAEEEPVMDAEGFVDTGDIVERRGDRYYFLGRRSGVINVGGLKVYPEEVEATLNRHPAVRMSRVHPRRNPIMGSLVVADVVLNHGPDNARGRIEELEREILKLCHEVLPRHKVPAALNFVSALDVAATGKVLRQNA